MKGIGKFILATLFVLFTLGNTQSYAIDVDCGPSGGYGGNPFHDASSGAIRITAVKVNSGAYIDSIQIIYLKSAHSPRPGMPTMVLPVAQPKHGGEGGNLSTMELDADEYITSVGGKYGKYIDSFYIKTNKGKIKKWGGPGGTVNFSYNVPDDHTQIIGFLGQSGKYVDAIGVIMRSTE